MPAKVLSTKRITVRPFTLQDFPEWQKSLRERKVSRKAFDMGPVSEDRLTKERFRKKLQDIKKRAKKDQIYHWGVFHKGSGECLGEIDIAVINRAPFSWGNLGYQINNQFSGKGYGKEAAKLGVQMGFEALKLHRLEVVMQTNHKASKAIAESLKAQFEGVRKKFIPTSKGWKDALVYSKVSSQKRD